MPTFNDLMTSPLVTLAQVALDDNESVAYRMAHGEALQARQDEFNGSGWILLTSFERVTITRALRLNMPNDFYPVTWPCNWPDSVKEYVWPDSEKGVES